MANTTFSGPVRSENGFVGATKNSTTGAFTNNFQIDSSGNYVGTLMIGQGIANVPCAATAGTNEVTFSQPDNTVITSIQIVCQSAPTVASGDIGFKVGTATGGAQLVAEITDQILDGGTTVPAGAHYALTLLDTTGSDASPAASPRSNVSGAARNIFCQIITSTNASAVGNFAFIINYKQFA